MFCNQILYSQLLFHTESYNNFLPGATIHLCKQTQISPLSVDYWKARHLNLSNCITLHNLLSGVLKNNSPSMWNSYVSLLGHIRYQITLFGVRPQLGIALVAMLTFCLIIRKPDHKKFWNKCTATAIISLTCSPTFIKITCLQLF